MGRAQLRQEEARLEKLFSEQRASRGLDDDVTLSTFFKAECRGIAFWQGL